MLSVVKSMFGERIVSRLVMMQNKELMFRVMAYNMHRLTVFVVWFLQSHFEPTGISLKNNSKNVPACVRGIIGR